jgi:AhpC/TSA antioxidant enzyme
MGVGVRVRAGDIIRIRELYTFDDRLVRVPDPAGVTHLQFRRFAGCPICDMHLRSMVVRHDEILAEGIHEVVLFHSTREEVGAYVGDLPFDVIADADKQLYDKFGVRTALRSVVDPRAIAPVLTSMVRPPKANRAHLNTGLARPTGGRLGLPADILIDTTGTVLASKYGIHGYDQWSVDELLTLAATRRKHFG